MNFHSCPRNGFQRVVQSNAKKKRQVALEIEKIFKPKHGGKAIIMKRNIKWTTVSIQRKNLHKYIQQQQSCKSQLFGVGYVDLLPLLRYVKSYMFS